MRWFREAQSSCHAAAGFAEAVFLAAALGGVDGLIDGDDDVGHCDVRCLAAEAVAAPGAAGRLDQLVAAQLAEQLFEVRQRDLLPLADRGQRDRTGVLTQRQIDHGCDRKTAFGSETHRKLLQVLTVEMTPWSRTAVTSSPPCPPLTLVNQPVGVGPSSRSSSLCC